jgi:hypothetical protein
MWVPIPRDPSAAWPDVQGNTAIGKDSCTTVRTTRLRREGLVEFGKAGALNPLIFYVSSGDM